MIDVKEQHSLSKLSELMVSYTEQDNLEKDKSLKEIMKILKEKRLDDDFDAYVKEMEASKKFSAQLKKKAESDEMFKLQNIKTLEIISRSQSAKKLKNIDDAKSDGKKNTKKADEAMGDFDSSMSSSMSEFQQGFSEMTTAMGKANSQFQEVLNTSSTVSRSLMGMLTPIVGVFKSVRESVKNDLEKNVSSGTIMKNAIFASTSGLAAIFAAGLALLGLGLNKYFERLDLLRNSVSRSAVDDAGKRIREIRINSLLSPEAISNLSDTMGDKFGVSLSKSQKQFEAVAMKQSMIERKMGKAYSDQQAEAINDLIMVMSGNTPSKLMDELAMKTMHLANVMGVSNTIALKTIKTIYESNKMITKGLDRASQKEMQESLEDQMTALMKMGMSKEEAEETIKGVAQTLSNQEETGKALSRLTLLTEGNTKGSEVFKKRLRDANMSEKDARELYSKATTYGVKNLTPAERKKLGELETWRQLAEASDQGDRRKENPGLYAAADASGIKMNSGIENLSKKQTLMQSSDKFDEGMKTSKASRKASESSIVLDKIAVSLGATDSDSRNKIVDEIVKSLNATMTSEAKAKKNSILESSIKDELRNQGLADKDMEGKSLEELKSLVKNKDNLNKLEEESTLAVSGDKVDKVSKDLAAGKDSKLGDKVISVTKYNAVTDKEVRAVNSKAVENSVDEATRAAVNIEEGLIKGIEANGQTMADIMDKFAKALKVVVDFFDRYGPMLIATLPALLLGLGAAIIAIKGFDLAKSLYNFVADTFKSVTGWLKTEAAKHGKGRTLLKAGGVVGAVAAVGFAAYQMYDSATTPTEDIKSSPDASQKIDGATHTSPDSKDLEKQKALMLAQSGDIETLTKEQRTLIEDGLQRPELTQPLDEFNKQLATVSESNKIMNNFSPIKDASDAVKKVASDTVQATKVNVGDITNVSDKSSKPMEKQLNDMQNSIKSDIDKTKAEVNKTDKIREEKNNPKQDNSSIFTSITNFFKKTWNEFSSWVGSIWTKISDWFKSIGEFFSNLGSNLLDGIKNIVVKTFSAIGDLFSGIKEWWDSFELSDIVSTITTVFSKIMHGIWDFFTSLPVRLFKSIVNLIPGAPKLAKSLGLVTEQEYDKMVKGEFNAFEGFGAGVGDKLGGAVTGLGAGVSELWVNGSNAVANTLQSVGDKIMGNDKVKNYSHEKTGNANAIDSIIGVNGKNIVVKLESGKIITRSGTVAWRTNNPGNIRDGKKYGAIGQVPGPTGYYAVFPTPEAGKAAMTMLLRGDGYSKLSIEEAMNKYAPPSENNTAAYIDFLEKGVGVSRRTKVGDLTPQQFEKFENMIMKYEGYFVGGKETEGSAVLQQSGTQAVDGFQKSSGMSVVSQPTKTQPQQNLQQSSGMTMTNKSATPKTSSTEIPKEESKSIDAKNEKINASTEKVYSDKDKSKDEVQKSEKKGKIDQSKIPKTSGQNIVDQLKKSKKKTEGISDEQPSQSSLTSILAKIKSGGMSSLSEADKSTLLLNVESINKTMKDMRSMLGIIGKDFYTQYNDMVLLEAKYSKLSQNDLSKAIATSKTQISTNDQTNMVSYGNQGAPLMVDNKKISNLTTMGSNISNITKEQLDQAKTLKSLLEQNNVFKAQMNRQLGSMNGITTDMKGLSDKQKQKNTDIVSSVVSH